MIKYLPFLTLSYIDFSFSNFVFSIGCLCFPLYPALIFAFPTLCFYLPTLFLTFVYCPFAMSLTTPEYTVYHSGETQAGYRICPCPHCGSECFLLSISNFFISPCNYERYIYLNRMLLTHASPFIFLMLRCGCCQF